MDKYEIRLSGTGGQGLILAGIILAEAAVLDGKNAVQSQSYGPEARGGASKSEIIISGEKIYYPKVQNPDIFLALSQEAYDKYISGISPEAVIIIDTCIKTHDCAGRKVLQVPILDTAVEKVGKAMTANIVSLGAIVRSTGIVSEGSLERAVLSRVPKGTEELNRKAIAEGYALVGNNLFCKE